MASRRLNQSASVYSILALLFWGAVSEPAIRQVCAETKPPLLSLEQFCRMDRATVARRETVRLRGTVTYTNRSWGVSFIQTDDCAVMVVLDQNIDADLKAGQLVELTGRPGFGKDSTILWLAESRVIGEGIIPKPVQLDRDRPFTMDLLHRWSEIEGQIYTVRETATDIYLRIAGEEFGVLATVSDSKHLDLPAIEDLRNCAIRLRGVLVMSADARRPFELQLQVPAGVSVEVIENPSGKGGIKPRPIFDTQRREMRGDAEAPARFRAVVRSVFPPDRLFLSDDTDSLFVHLSSADFTKHITAGDVVEVEGRIDRSLKRPYLRDAQARYLGKGYSGPPVVISPVGGTKHFAEFVQLKGMLVAKEPEKYWMLLRSGGIYFRSWYQDDDAAIVRQAGVGSQISVSGGCWISPSDDAMFDISASSVNVLFEVSDTGVTPDTGDTARSESASEQELDTDHAVMFESGFQRSLFFTLLVVFLTALIWLVYRRLKEQQRFQESIHEQLSNLSHIARLNTLAEMVGALAHELNQPLASVSNYAATAEILSRKESVNSEKLAGVLTSIGQEAYRAGEIIRRLRHLVRKKTPGLLPVQLSEIISETVELFRTQHVTARGLVQVDVPDDLPTVMADSVQVQQVILNLLLNARDATEARSDRPPLIRIETSLDSAMIVVSVTDNGIGIANSNPDAIFEPYFTTREKGTGLGLAISRTIIETHGGRIAAEKLTPQGTRITFSLPVTSSRSVGSS